MNIKLKLSALLLTACVVLQGQVVAGMNCHNSASDGVNHAQTTTLASASKAHDNLAAAHQASHKHETGEKIFGTDHHATMQTDSFESTQNQVADSSVDACAFCAEFCSMAQALNSHRAATLLDMYQPPLVSHTTLNPSSLVLEGLLRPPRS